MADQMNNEALPLALAGEFRAAIEAGLGTALTVAVGPAPDGIGWGTPITATGALDGLLTVWIDEPGVAVIAAMVMGLDESPDPSIAADMLKELWAQAASSTALKGGFEGVTLTPGTGAQAVIPAGAAGLSLRDGDKVIASLAITGTVTRRAVASAASAPATAQSRGDYPGNLAALLDIDLPLVVRFARTEMSLRALAQLGPGSMVDMGRSPDAPVQLLIGSQVVAEGEVVVVSGNYGVRITSLVSPADRLRAMEL